MGLDVKLVTNVSRGKVRAASDAVLSDLAWPEQCDCPLESSGWLLAGENRSSNHKGQICQMLWA